MRIQMLRTGGTLFGHFNSGDIVDVPEVIAMKWRRIGYAKLSRMKAQFVVKPGTQKAVRV